MHLFIYLFIYLFFPNYQTIFLPIYIIYSGMLAHCGYENDMKISYNNITDQLLCAMRVHLMNESEVHVFCPKDVMVIKK
jgi:hypothetical protein